MANEVSVTVVLSFELTIPIKGMPNKSDDGIVQQVFDTSWSEEICRLSQAGLYSIEEVYMYDASGSQIF